MIDPTNKLESSRTNSWQRLSSEYGMLLVLLILLASLSLATIDYQQSVGASAGREILKKINKRSAPIQVLVAVPEGKLDLELAQTIKDGLNKPHKLLKLVRGGPRDANLALKSFQESGTEIDLIVCSAASAKWDPILNSDVETIQPARFLWPSMLMPDNLVTIVQRITIIAIIAIGMTMVIITAGIDLSVGSLIALSAVVAGILIRDCFGGTSAHPLGLWLASIGAIVCCGFVGLCTGFFVAAFRLPPFIVTLAMMLLIRGVANVLSEQKTIHEIPVSFDALGKGYWLGIPVSVWLMIALFAVAWFVMSRTTLGRQIYAVGGNEEAARLSGVRVKRVQLIVYSVCGLLAGLGGVIQCSQLRSAKASYGQMDELTVIAAVVVGGTSLMGGQGKMLGTLIGALIIGVIQNGMNQLHLDDKTQMISLGAVILVAVLLDKIKKGQVRWSEFKSVFNN